MSGRFIHIAVGEIIGLPLVGLTYYYFTNELDYLVMTLIILVSLVSVFFGAILPDLIERPKDADHRKFFHSWVLFALSFVASFLMAFVIIPLYSHLFYVYPIFGFCLGYFSHLLLDSATKRSLT